MSSEKMAPVNGTNFGKCTAATMREGNTETVKMTFAAKKEKTPILSMYWQENNARMSNSNSSRHETIQLNAASNWPRNG